jgi:hypothetical protein
VIPISAALVKVVLLNNSYSVTMILIKVKMI